MTGAPPGARRLLWVTTKPPWPPVDGGRLVAARTIEALAAAGHSVEVLSPDVGPEAAAPAGIELRRVAARPRPWLLAAPRAWFSGRALSITRHDLPGLRAAVAARIARAPRIEFVVAEQVQALAQCQPARAAGIPVVLRAQNVESDLWDALARRRPAWRPLLLREARRLRAAEGSAVAECAATVALSTLDARRLASLAPAARVEHVPAPFPAELPQADAPLPGEPAVVLFGGAGWVPNAAGAAWFASQVWPAVRAALPQARLHVFGALPRETRHADGIVRWPAPLDSREAFAPGSILAVPVHVASGVRLRILEAWARGVPVVATPEAAAGLDAETGRELWLARDADEYVDALRRLSQPATAAGVVAAGREVLRRWHAPARVAARLEALFDEVCAAERARL